MKKLSLLLAIILSICSLFACNIFDAPSKNAESKESVNNFQESSQEESGYNNNFNYTGTPDVDEDEFSFDLPEGWSVSSLSGIAIYYAPNGITNLNVLYENIPAGINAEGYWNSAKGVLESQYLDFTVQSTGGVSIGGKAGYYSNFKANVNGMNLNFYQFYLVQNNTAYVITFTETEGSVDYSDDLSIILDSFTIK